MSSLLHALCNLCLTSTVTGRCLLVASTQLLVVYGSRQLTHYCPHFILGLPVNVLCCEHAVWIPLVVVCLLQLDTTRADRGSWTMISCQFAHGKHWHKPYLLCTELLETAQPDVSDYGISDTLHEKISFKFGNITCFSRILAQCASLWSDYFWNFVVGFKRAFAISNTLIRFRYNLRCTFMSRALPLNSLQVIAKCTQLESGGRKQAMASQYSTSRRGATRLATRGAQFSYVAVFLGQNSA